MNVEVKQGAIDDILREAGKKDTDYVLIGYVSGRVSGNNAQIDAVCIPKQTFGGDAPHVTPKAVADAVELIKTSGRTVIGVFQYNSGMYDIFEAGILKKTKEQLVIPGVPDLALIVKSNSSYRIVG